MSMVREMRGPNCLPSQGEGSTWLVSTIWAMASASCSWWASARWLKTIFLAGIGAVATGAEKSTEIVNKLVEKGELTVAQGKAVNEELKHTIKNAAGDTSEAVLRAKLKAMTPEERAAWVKSAQKIADDLDAEPVEVEVEDADDAEKDKPTE